MSDDDNGFRCKNCGTEIDKNPSIGSTIECPVCHRKALITKDGSKILYKGDKIKSNTKNKIKLPVIPMETNLMELIALGIVGIIAIAIILSAIVTVGAGSIGVLLNWGGSTNVTLSQGIHFIVPIEQSVVLMNTQTQADTLLATGASKDLQNTNTTVTLDFYIDSRYAPQIYNNYGVNYINNIVNPTIQGVVKQVTAKFNATDLIDNRPLVQQEIQDNLTSILSPYHIIVQQAPITNFQFSTQFEQAIELKVAQQQNLQTQLINLSITRVKANQTIAAALGNATARIVQANGTAKAAQILNSAFSSNPKYLQYIAITEWNGRLPTYWASGNGNTAIPFIGINATLTNSSK